MHTVPATVLRAPATRARGISISARKVLVCLGLLAVVLGVVGFAPSRTTEASRAWPLDFDLNWVAAHRLVEHQPLYDRNASHNDAIDRVGPWMAKTNGDPYRSYIGTPPVALVHIPFLVFDHDTAVELFRVTTFVGMLLALGLACAALPRGSRLAAGVAISGFVAIAFPVVQTIELGQGNHLMMLALALALFGVAHQRWGLAGIGLGIATVLKVSPVLLVVYLALQRKWRAVGAAAATCAAMIVAAATIGRPGDMFTWLREVAPSVSSGSAHVNNQSLVAWVTRLVTPRTDLTHQVSLGPSRFAAYAIAVAGVVLLSRPRRGRHVEPLDLSVIVLLMLLAGPLSWDHYSSWALVALVPVLDARRWVGRSRVEQLVLAGGLIGAAMLFAGRIVWPTAAEVAADPFLRVVSGRYVLALALCLAVALRLRLNRPEPAPEFAGHAPMPSTRRVMAARRVMADVHAR